MECVLIVVLVMYTVLNNPLAVTIIIKMKKKKQYIYTELWRKLRDHLKIPSLFRFTGFTRYGFE